ncbi:MAG TPA: hypothetical protein VIQ31_18580, partial [Phormidium sp.]
IIFRTGAPNSKNRFFIPGRMAGTIVFCRKIRFLRQRRAIVIPGIENNNCRATWQQSINSSINTSINTNFVGGKTLWVG